MGINILLLLLLFFVFFCNNFDLRKKYNVCVWKEITKRVDTYIITRCKSPFIWNCPLSLVVNPHLIGQYLFQLDPHWFNTNLKVQIIQVTVCIFPLHYTYLTSRTINLGTFECLGNYIIFRWRSLSYQWLTEDLHLVLAGNANWRLVDLFTSL